MKKFVAIVATIILISVVALRVAVRLGHSSKQVQSPSTQIEAKLAEAPVPVKAPEAVATTLPKSSETSKETVEKRFGILKIDGWENARFGEFAQQAVSAFLKDPESAKFSEMFLVDDRKVNGKRDYVYCGFVNAKNSFGAYSGKSRFVYIPALNLVSIGTQKTVNLWNKYCSGSHPSE